MTTDPSIPLISQGWLRVLIFCVVHLLLILTGVWLMTLLIHHLEGDEVEAIDLMKGEWLWAVIVMSFAGSMTVTFFFRRWVDRKSFISLGLDFRYQGADLITGATLAFAMLGLGTLILNLTGNLKWTDILFDGKSLGIAFVNLLLVAIYEEVLFRGYILNNLLGSLNKWAAISIAAALFTLFHLGNPGFDFISVVNLFGIGFLLGLYYAYTRRLGFCIAFHFVWNFLEGPLLGYPVSGIHFDSLLLAEFKNNTSVTGGSFGLEGSVVATGVCLIALLAVYVILQKKISPLSPSAPGQK